MPAFHQNFDADRVDRKHASELGGGVGLPSGIIVMWHGLKANIPTGWALCDGTLGTPDLREKFVMGVPDGEEAGGLGGSLSKSHSGCAVADHPATATSEADVGATKIGTTTSTATLKTHKHNTPILTHSVTQPNDHPDIRPPYYKICFIMKV